MVDVDTVPSMVTFYDVSDILQQPSVIREREADYVSLHY
jgi:hypothetical protein